MYYAAAWLVTRIGKDMMADLGHADVSVVGAVSLFILLVAVAAALLPARRAAGVDPIVVLRND